MTELRIGPDREVTLHFAIRLDNGDEVDSTFDKRPATFRFGDEQASGDQIGIVTQRLRGRAFCGKGGRGEGHGRCEQCEDGKESKHGDKG